MNVPDTPKDWLLSALAEYGIAVAGVEGNMLYLEKGYDIEIEQNGVFKLRSEGSVVAPFRDLDELCQFIKYAG